MKENITNLKQELDEHREVEKELAKRSHFCNQIISKYKTNIKTLQSEVAERAKMANDTI